jgi:hypothetical protein
LKTKTLSDQLRDLIRAHGSPRSVSQAVAEAEGPDAPSIERQLQRFAKGERSLSLETVDRIGLALGMRVIEAVALASASRMRKA